jgi:hypothetical protein
MKMASSFYFTEGFNSMIDCYANPLVTPDWILAKYPEKITIGICEIDPLRDDAYRYFGFFEWKLG